MKPYKNILPSAEELKRQGMRFVILDGNGSNVLGNPPGEPGITLDNAAFTGLEEIIQYGCENLKSLAEMEVNESAQCRFRMCGTTGVYKVLRVA